MRNPIKQKPRTTKLTDAQNSVLSYTASLGKVLVREIPEIGEDYVDRGLTLKEIVQEYDIIVRYGITSPNPEPIAMSAVYSALEELIGRDKRAEVGSRNVARALEANRRLGGFSIEEQKEYGRRSGTKHKDNRTAIFSAEARAKLVGRETEIGRTGGRASVEARGLVAYVTAEESPNKVGELDYVNFLCSDNNYLHQERQFLGRPNWKLITDEVNRVYHNSRPVRQAKPLKSAIYRSRV